MKKTIALLLTLCAVMIPFTAFADGNDYEGTGNSQTVELIGQPNSDSPSTKSVVVPGGTANLTAMSGGQLHWRVTSTLGNILGFKGKGVCTGGIILFSSPAEASFTIR
ncbi:hypothetical protein E5F43_10635 [Clostridioides difficile]|uniref:hypothetical protein n=1 Tax=Clostridioides difficile TaxID=1496 RepID=UPI00107EAEAF|nr:hypothetical protein [Clostridioides difficile]MDL0302742.1 hypothetical protein [Clostridioides difficile]TGA29214.1 hypothetical protein E5F43_10635 [Clostridioides difficile]